MSTVIFSWKGKELKAVSYKALTHKQFCGVVGPINNPVVVIPYNQIVVSCK
jgi:hypothetical protein